MWTSSRWREKKETPKNVANSHFFPMTQQHQCGTSFFTCAPHRQFFSALWALELQQQQHIKHELSRKQQQQRVLRKNYVKRHQMLPERQTIAFVRNFFIVFIVNPLLFFVSFFTFQCKLSWFSAQGKKVDGPSIFHRSIFACLVTDFQQKKHEEKWWNVAVCCLFSYHRRNDAR